MIEYEASETTCRDGRDNLLGSIPVALVSVKGSVATAMIPAANKGEPSGLACL